MKILLILFFGNFTFAQEGWYQCGRNLQERAVEHEIGKTDHWEEVIVDCKSDEKILITSEWINELKNMPAFPKLEKPLQELKNGSEVLKFYKKNKLSLLDQKEFKRRIDGFLKGKLPDNQVDAPIKEPAQNPILLVGEIKNGILLVFLSSNGKTQHAFVIKIIRNSQRSK